MPPNSNANNTQAQIQARAQMELNKRANKVEIPEFRDFVVQVSPQYEAPDHLRPMYLAFKMALTPVTQQVTIPSSWAGPHPSGPLYQFHKHDNPAHFLARQRKRRAALLADPSGYSQIGAAATPAFSKGRAAEFNPATLPPLPVEAPAPFDQFGYMEPVMGGNARAIINAPPRHAKTESFLHLVALFEKIFPDKSSCYVSYNQDQAETKIVIAQDLCLRSGISPDPRLANKAEWKIDGHSGRLIATGVGGSLTGKGVHLLLIDDSIKNREEAESQRIRDSQIAWYDDVAETRIEPGGSILISMTRWHEMDIAGQVGKRKKADGSPEFQLIRIPAASDGLDPWGRKQYVRPTPKQGELQEAIPAPYSVPGDGQPAIDGVPFDIDNPLTWPNVDGQGNRFLAGVPYTYIRPLDSHLQPSSGTMYENITTVYQEGDQINMDPLGREVGKALWGKRYNELWLQNVQRNKPNTWISLYQGLPRSAGDQIFKGVHYYNPYNPLEVFGPHNGYFEHTAGADLAYSEQTYSNRTAYGYGRYRGDRLQIVYAEQWKKEISYTAQHLLDLQAKHGTTIAMEGGGPQKGVVGLLRAKNLIIRETRMGGDKIAKSAAVAEAWNSGKIEVPKGEPWVAEFLEVLYDFTGFEDASDDYVDMLANMYDTVLRRLGTYNRIVANGGVDPYAPQNSYGQYTVS